MERRSLIIKYQVEIDNGGFGAWIGVGGVNSYTVTGLANGTAHQFRVRAVNAVGDGDATSEVSSTPFGPPMAPTNFTVTVDSSTEVTLDWELATARGLAITGYQYQQDEGGLGLCWGCDCNFDNDNVGLEFWRVLHI